MGKSTSRKFAGALMTGIFFLIYCLVAMLSVSNISTFWALVPYRWFAVGSLVLLALFLPLYARRLKLILYVLFAVWLLVVPYCPWSRETKLFIKGGLLRRGMTMEQVEKHMEGFHLEPYDGGQQWNFAPQSPSADWVIVRFREGKVVDIGMSPD